MAILFTEGLSKFSRTNVHSHFCQMVVLPVTTFVNQELQLRVGFTQIDGERLVLSIFDQAVFTLHSPSSLYFLFSILLEAFLELQIEIHLVLKLVAHVSKDFMQLSIVWLVLIIKMGVFTRDREHFVAQEVIARGDWSRFKSKDFLVKICIL